MQSRATAVVGLIGLVDTGVSAPRHGFKRVATIEEPTRNFTAVPI
jgi:hypothetical protein